jgi:leucyl aminopeptidase (aminopeptidase T)
MIQETEEARMTSPEGSDITFSLKDCTFGQVYDGICRPGEFDAVPTGVIDALPVPGTGNGVIVIDAGLAGYGIARTPVRLTLKDGNFTKIEGGPEARWLDKRMKKVLHSGDENANHWAEFLIGLNPAAQIICQGGGLLEDERLLGTVSIGWGRDTHQGGTVYSDFHGDGMVLDVTIMLDDVTIIENGKPTAELF